MKSNKLTKGSNMRWESSRMMLPEHVRTIRQHLRDLEKIDRPLLDEQEQAEISRTIRKAVEESRPVTLRYYKDGFIETMNGHLSLSSIPGEPLQINDCFGILWKIAFRDLVGVGID